MILIFGGAYQGKREFAKRTFNLKDEDMEYAGEKGWRPGSGKAIYGLEDFTLNCVREGVSPAERLAEFKDELASKILLMEDVSQGVVPMDETERLWREENGRAMIALAGQAEEVHRVFLGIGSRVK